MPSRFPAPKPVGEARQGVDEQGELRRLRRHRVGATDRYARRRSWRMPCRRTAPAIPRLGPASMPADPYAPDSLADTVASVIADGRAGRSRGRHAASDRRPFPRRLEAGVRRGDAADAPRGRPDRGHCRNGGSERLTGAPGPERRRSASLAQCALPNRRLARGRADCGVVVEASTHRETGRLKRTHPCSTPLRSSCSSCGRSGS